MRRSLGPLRHGLHPGRMRNVNRALVLQLLRRFQRLSRAEIARRSSLSEGTVSRIIATLIGEKLVVEQGAENSTGGRPGTRLELDDRHYRSIGVEIQNWETRVSTGSLNGRLLETTSLRTPAPVEAALDLIARECREFGAGISSDRLAGIGVSVRGVVDNETGTVIIGSQPNWSGARIGESLSERTGIPVRVENNVRAAALAEFNLGWSDLQNAHCLLYVRIDEGVGAGIVLQGSLLRGPHLAAGELGQMVVADSPGGGKQDRPGCLESLASNPGLCDVYADLSGAGRRTKSGESSARARLICHLAMNGEDAARQAVAQAARYLGIGLSNLVWVLDADAIVIDGVITEAWPLVAAAVQEEFPSGDEFSNFNNLLLRPSALGPDAPLIGAVQLPFATLFADGDGAGVSEGLQSGK
ncbi:MAG: ROK family transcriptional regulator [Bryobacterales bacterium]|nr:ROK family transcriptional regulator [Bryobacterales bacterium]